jgi:hypothetical protein
MAEIEREYRKKAEEGVSVDDYPLVNNDEVVFPPDICISYAVCRKECGAAQFIVDGSTQICENCGGVMLRTVVKRYRVTNQTEPPPPIDPSGYEKGTWVEYKP